MQIKEYMKLHNLTQPAVLYRIKKGKIKAKKNDDGKWIIEDNEEKQEQDDIQKKLELAQQEIEHLKIRLQDKVSIIEAERRSNIALLHSVEHYKALEQKKKGFIARLFNIKK